MGLESDLRPGIFRRCAAIVYDGLLLLAVLFLATLLLLPLNSGKAFTSEQVFFPIYLLIVSFVFYGWFWTHGGQTLGLKAWKLRLKTFDGGSLTWPQAGLRFSLALIGWLFFGLGFMCLLLNKNRYTWYDFCSSSSVYFDEPRYQP